ncbi:MAG: thioredoxin family protein [Limnohabitans sp.]|nr:thioredoxin family protein [Limnohabitans sp.]
MNKKIFFSIAFIALISIFGFKTFTPKKEVKENLVWHTDVKKAMEIAKKEDKPMFLFFTGSDWCGWCMRLQSEVFKTTEFESWAKEKVVLVELDFPRRSSQTEEIKTQNMQLQQVLGVQGYPTVWFVKSEQKDGAISLQRLGSTGYVAGGPKVWIEGANQILTKYVSDKKPSTATKPKAVKSKK